MPIRSPGGAGCAGRVGVGVAGTGCAGGLTGVGLIAAFAAGLGFFGGARRAGAFFASFFLSFLVFLRVVASVGEGFFRFGFVFPFAFFLVAIFSLPSVFPCAT